MDVYTKAMIPFTTAVFGGEVIVPTLYGKSSVYHPSRNTVGDKDPAAGQRNRIDES